jgi:hypothetical protein
VKEEEEKLSQEEDDEDARTNSDGYKELRVGIGESTIKCKTGQTAGEESDDVEKMQDYIQFFSTVRPSIVKRHDIFNVDAAPAVPIVDHQNT